MSERPALVYSGLLPLWRRWRIFILSWAIREIHPLHPDVPSIVHELNHWERCNG